MKITLYALLFILQMSCQVNAETELKPAICADTKPVKKSVSVPRKVWNGTCFCARKAYNGLRYVCIKLEKPLAVASHIANIYYATSGGR